MTNSIRPIRRRRIAFTNHRRMDPKKWLRISDVATLGGAFVYGVDRRKPISNNGVRRWIDAGLPFYETPLGRLFHIDDVKAFLGKRYPKKMAALAESQRAARS